MDTVMNFKKIIEGPSREVLVDAFRYSFDKNIKVNLEFTLVNDEIEFGLPREATMRVKRIDSIEHAEGDGKSFFFEAYGESGNEKVCFEAWYSTQSRTGNIIHCWPA